MSAGTRQALTEEQRQQIIAKLLSERRSKAACVQAPHQQAELPHDERAARLQEIISSRRAAAAKPQQQQGVEQHGQQHHMQQQPHRHQQHRHEPAHTRAHQAHAHAQPQQQHCHQQQRRRSSSTGDSLVHDGSQDPLLSPGSTASLVSQKAAAGEQGARHGHHQHHQQLQQQQQHASVLQQQHQRGGGSSGHHGAAVHGPLPGFTAPQQSRSQNQALPPQRQQKPSMQQLSPQPAQQQQQRQQQDSRSAAAVDRSALSKVLDGPVDISDLWASRASLTEQQSQGELSGDTGHSYSQGSGAGLSSGRSSISDSGSGSEASYDGDDASDSLYDEGHAAGAATRCSDLLGQDDELEADWQLSGSLTFSPVPQIGHKPQQAKDGQLLQQQQQRLLQLQQLQRELQEKRQQRGQAKPQLDRQQAMQQHPQQQQQQFHRPSPPPLPRQQQQLQEQRLPVSYPASRTERLQQLAQPKAAQRQKYEQMKAEAEQQVLQQCSFTPKTGRGPQHRCGLPGSVGERLHKAAAEKQARLEKKAAELANSDVQDCTFQPATNASTNERVLESYEYVPLHRRLGQVMRSRSEKLAHIQQQVEAEASSQATFAPRINPRSSMLVQRSRSCSRVRGGAAGEDRSPPPGRSCGTAPNSPYRGGGQQRDTAADGRDVSRGRSRERLRRTWSEANLSGRGRSQARPEDSACTFAPSINARSEKMLQASGEIPLSFLQRQEYFDRLAREKKQLLQLAVEDAHCSFAPATVTRSSSRSGRSDRGGSLDQESFLDRIERLAYADKRRLEASRSALADHVHASECTFRPAINQRSARMVRATPLQELYENSKGRIRRDSVALALELQEQAECTFTPNLRKTGPPSASPAEAKLNLSAEEVAGVVERLYTDPRSKEARAGEAASYQQYQELKACTFKPEINRDVPKQQGPVLVRGLGRFLELKDMARQQAEVKAAVEAKVFITQPKAPTAPFTTPQPFQLGPVVPSGYEARRRRAVVEAESALMGECTFQPRINSNHKTRQERVAELLARH